MVEAIETGTFPNDLLVIGPAGTGKTYGILTVLHCLAADHPNLRILFVRQTRTSLTESILVTFEQEILPADGMEYLAEGVLRRVRQSYRYPNGSEIVLRGLDSPTGVYSTAWDIIFINEAIEVQVEAWETLVSRMNRPGRNTQFGWVIGDTNPGHPSHWLKARCEAGTTTPWDTTHEANPAMHDGENWTPAGLKYLGQLDTLTGTRKARLRHGLWAVGEGLWFDGFDVAKHVSLMAEFDPALKVQLPVDSGVHTGAVWFQVREISKTHHLVNVFADYFSEGMTAESNARAIIEVGRQRCLDRRDIVSTDPAGGARNPIGATVIAEYCRAGLCDERFLKRWPIGPVADGLALIDSLIQPSDGNISLTIHPRCTRLIAAFQGYARAKRAGQWQDYPEDPQHPHEDLMDALRGGLKTAFPEGRKPPSSLKRVPARKVF